MAFGFEPEKTHRSWRGGSCEDWLKEQVGGYLSGAMVYLQRISGIQRTYVMEITFEEQDDRVVFKVRDLDGRYGQVLKLCFYEFRDGYYVKSFSRDIRDLERIRAYYARQAQEMFDQLAYYKPVPWEQALAAFADEMKQARIDWWLTGSCAACIRGIPFDPHDIDIMVDSKDVDRIKDQFAGMIIEPIIDTGGWLTRDFGVLFLHARIDIASDPVAALDDPEPVDCGPYARNHLETVAWNGFHINVPPVHLQLAVNKKRGRLERARLLETWIHQHRS